MVPKTSVKTSVEIVAGSSVETGNVGTSLLCKSPALRTGLKISAGRVPKMSIGRVVSSAGRALRISATGTPWSRRSLIVVWMGTTTSTGRI